MTRLATTLLVALLVPSLASAEPRSRAEIERDIQSTSSKISALRHQIETLPEKNAEMKTAKANCDDLDTVYKAYRKRLVDAQTEVNDAYKSYKKNFRLSLLSKDRTYHRVWWNLCNVPYAGRLANWKWFGPFAEPFKKARDDFFEKRDAFHAEKRAVDRDLARDLTLPSMGLGPFTSYAAFKSAYVAKRAYCDDVVRPYMKNKPDGLMLRRELLKLEGQLARLRAELSGLDAPRSDPDADSGYTPPPREPLRIRGQVVGAAGHGKPEGFGSREQCSWKFRVRFTAENKVQIRKWRVVSERHEPRDIQRRHGPMRVLRSGDDFVEFGPAYLTVRKQDQYRGRYEAVFEFTDSNGFTRQHRVTWQSTTRPPVGPPQSSLVARYRGRLTNQFAGIYKKALADMARQLGGTPSGDMSAGSAELELHLTDDTPVARVKPVTMGLTADVRDTQGNFMRWSLRLTFTFRDAKRRADGQFAGRVSATLSGTARATDGSGKVQQMDEPPTVPDMDWRAVQADRAGQMFRIYIGKNKTPLFELRRTP